MIPKVLSVYENKNIQTDSSVYDENTSFNFENDENIKFEAQIPQLSYEPEMVQGIIRPLTVGPDGTIVNHHIPRLFKRKNAPMIRNLTEQIEGNKSYKSEYVRQMAAALIPGLKDSNYRSLFTDPLKIPYTVIDAQFTPLGSIESLPCKAIFSLDGKLTIQTENQNLNCEIELWDKLVAGRELNVIFGDQNYGKLQILQDVEPINFENGTPKQLLDALHLDSEDKLATLITENDTSLVDVILSIPTLSAKDANDLLAVLHNRKLLAPYIRSKVCALQLSNPLEKRNWPELLGRFVFLLDPKWTYVNIPLLRNNDVMAIFRHIRDLNDGALYVLQVALKALDETRGADPLLFFWTLVFMSLLQNATLANKAHADRLTNKMIQMWKELQKKKEESNTRKITFEIIDYIKDIKQFKLSSVVHEDNELIASIFKEHHNAIFTILRINPFRREESHPLYFPVVLALEAALIQAMHNEEFISSDSESLNGDLESESTISSRQSTHSKHSKIEEHVSDSLNSQHSQHSVHSQQQQQQPEADPNPSRPFFDAKLYYGYSTTKESVHEEDPDIAVVKVRNLGSQVDEDENPTMESDHSYSSQRNKRTYSTNDSAKKTYSTQGSQRKSHATNESAKKSYLTNESTPKSYATNESAKKTYSTNESAKKSYATNESAKKSYATNESAKKSYATNESAKKSYATNESAKKSYATNESGKKTYSTQGSQKKTYSRQDEVELQQQNDEGYYSDYYSDEQQPPQQPVVKSQYSANKTYSREGTYSTRSSSRKAPPPMEEKIDYSYSDDEQPAYSYSRNSNANKSYSRPPSMPPKQEDDYSYYSDV